MFKRILVALLGKLLGRGDGFEVFGVVSGAFGKDGQPKLEEKREIMCLY